MDTTALELISHVDAFYKSAWDKLIVASGIVLIIVPLLIQWYQNRRLSIEKKELLLEIQKVTQDLKSEIQSEIKEEISQRIQEIDSRVDNEIARTRGAVFHITASLAMNSKDYKGAVVALFDAAEYYSKASDYLNLTSILDGINDLFLKHITSEDLLEIHHVNDLDIDDRLNQIEAKDIHGSLAKPITKIKVELHKKRKPK